ncbi:MAG TPA: DUF6599 family protein [Terracidiphilus sp.]|jgi:hypothetical protein
MHWIRIFAAAAALAVAAVAVAQEKPAAKAAPSAAKAAPEKATTISLPRPLLPESFAGWVAKGAPTGISDPAQADAANAAALKEYGFQNGAAATYEREGQTLTLRALRFGDLSGAYGAYSFYRGTGWPKEEIGSGAASNHNRVIFWTGFTVVDATFSKIGSMSGSELRELARQMPEAQGTRALAPPILSILPKASLDGQTTHYALGPAGYVASGGVLPPDLVGFDRDAEAVTASYSLPSNSATLTLIEYPTPQMAAVYETKIRDYLHAGANAQPPFPKPLTDSDQASLEVKRSGPVVALVSGDAIPDESHKLLGSVYYREDLVSVPQPMESDVSKTGRLLWGIATLVMIGAGAAILLGFFLGGGRALYRIARGRPVSSVYEAEFIRLDLRE